MVPTVFFYPIMLLALVWLFLMLHAMWSRDRSVACRPLPRPITPPRQRSHEPKPFAGLTYKPHCAACEQEATPLKAPPVVPPDPMPMSTRRPRRVDTSMHFCPHPTCEYRGWVGLGNLRANGHPNGGPWRQFHCSACGGYVFETHGTILQGKRVPVELMVRVIACLAEGLGLRGTARVFEVDPNTVLQWLVEAADQLQAFSRYFLHDLHLYQVQLDELYGRVPSACGSIERTSQAEPTGHQLSGLDRDDQEHRASVSPLPIHTDTPSPLGPTLASTSVAYNACGWGHGGTRKSSPSRRVQTWSVNPAAIAGVRGCHRVAEPRPLVSRGCGTARRTRV
jgi:hypothetical protein